jgi:flagellar hook assembly protein FlgD
VRYEVDYVRIYQDQPVGMDATAAGTGRSCGVVQRTGPRLNTVWFDLRALASDQPVSIIMRDVSGRTIRHIDVPAGTEQYQWDGRDGQGMRVGPGVYFYTLQAAAAQANGSVVMLN